MAMLIQLDDGVGVHKFPLEKPQMHIGRAPGNDICIDDMLVSKQHAIIEAEDSPSSADAKVYHIQDLESTNNTFVNDKKITRLQLRNNDIIRIGLINFKFVDENEPELDKTAELKKSWIPGVFYTK